MTVSPLPRQARKNFEDVMLWRALKQIDHGFYIDVRAADPASHMPESNVFHDLGWHGINIEPVPEYYQQISRTCPDDINLPYAAGQTGSSVSAPVMPLSEVCARHVTGDIHFLKIDVAGAEKAVIQGMDFSQWKPWLVVVKATNLPTEDQSTYQEWDNLLLQADYRMIFFDGRSRYYLSAEHPELHDAFCTPSTIMDSLVGATRDSRLARLSAAEAEKIALNADLLAAQNKIREIQALAREREALMRRASEQLESVYASPSWKLTQPLRWLSHQASLGLAESEAKIRRLRNRFNKHRLLTQLMLFYARVPGMGWMARRISDNHPELQYRHKGMIIQIRPGKDQMQDSASLPASARKILADINRAAGQEKS